MTDFNPQKTAIADFPFPPGTAVLGSLGSLYTVVDRDGYAFLACCSWCEEHAMASGYYALHENGRLLVRDLKAANDLWQNACRTCVRDDYDVVPCPLPAGHDGDHVTVIGIADDEEFEGGANEPCGESSCICYGTGPDHAECACGCDCPRDDYGQLIHEG